MFFWWLKVKGIFLFLFVISVLTTRGLPMNANLCVSMCYCKWMRNCIGCFDHMFKMIVLLNDDSSVWKMLIFVFSTWKFAAGFCELVETTNLTFLFFKGYQMFACHGESSEVVVMRSSIDLWQRNMFVYILESIHHLHKEKPFCELLLNCPWDLVAVF